MIQTLQTGPNPMLQFNFAMPTNETILMQVYRIRFGYIGRATGGKFRFRKERMKSKSNAICDE